MTYIDYLNRFNQWLEANPLPASSQLIYYKLLNIFNRAGWPPSIQVDNLRLMSMTGMQSASTIISARDKLVDAGFIKCISGKKNYPNRYMLCEMDLFNCPNSDNKIQSKNRTENQTENATENQTEYQTENRSVYANHIKTYTNTKKKKKRNSPKPPRGALLPGEVRSYDTSELDALEFDLPEGFFE